MWLVKKVGAVLFWTFLGLVFILSGIILSPEDGAIMYDGIFSVCVGFYALWLWQEAAKEAEEYREETENVREMTEARTRAVQRNKEQAAQARQNEARLRLLLSGNIVATQRVALLEEQLAAANGRMVPVAPPQAGRRPQ